MKKTLLFTLVALMALPLAGQRPDPFERLVPSRKIQFNQDRQNKSITQESQSFRGLSPRPLLKSGHMLKMALDSVYNESVDWLTGEMEYSTKSIFFYDEAGNQVREVEYVWADGAWENDWMEEYFFDAAGNPIEGRFSGWDDFENDWVPVERERYYFDNAGNMVEIIIEDWDEFAEEWMPRWRDEFMYDAAGNVVRQTYYNYLEDETDWEPDFKNEITWENNNIIIIASYAWDLDDEDWVGDYNLEFYYDNGNPSGWAGFEWDPDSGEWVPDWRGEFSVNASGNVTEEVYTEYDPEEDEWSDPYTRIEYQYDNNQNRVWETTYFTDSYPDWEPFQRHEFTVNTDYTTDEILFPMFYGMLYFDWFGYQFPNMLVEIRELMHDGDDWMDWDRTVYYYSEVELEEPEVYVLTIQIEGNGTVEVNGEEYTQAVTLDRGIEVTLEAIPADGYEFAGWSGDLQSVQVEEIITMDSNKQITATFSVINTSVSPAPPALSVFPNPFTSNITIENNGPGGNLKITTLTGQTIRELVLKGPGTITLATGGLENGMYLLIFTPENGERVVMKMVKY
jgi:hypothetical protein